jgi:hypothetical protein
MAKPTEQHLANARKIANDLFGDADRLVLAKGTQLSGWAKWSKPAVVNRITEILGRGPSVSPAWQLIRDLATIPLDALGDENAPLSARMNLFSALCHMQERAIHELPHLR